MSSEPWIKKSPGSALSVVTEFSGSGLLNPKPAADPEEDLLEQRLSAHKLVRARRGEYTANIH